MEHLFFKCEFSGGVWNKVKNRIDLHGNHVRWHDIVHDLVNGNNGNNIGSLVKRLSFTA